MDLNALIEQGYQLKKLIEEQENTAKRLREDLLKMQNQILEKMKELNLTSMKHRDCTVIKTSRFTVKNPSTAEEKKAFFDYLQQKNIFEDMVSVNSMRLNAWYKEEIEAAIQSGNFGFKVPGLAEPTAFETISFRKA